MAEMVERAQVMQPTTRFFREDELHLFGKWLDEIHRARQRDHQVQLANSLVKHHMDATHQINKMLRRLSEGRIDLSVKDICEDLENQPKPI